MSGAAATLLAGGRRQIHLTGFMGSGKSTVGRLLARRLLWNFLDLDGVIERHAGRNVAQVFADDGEAGFRLLERHVFAQVVSKANTVVALGGGTLIDVDNRQLSLRNGVLVWLDCPLEVLQARCVELAGVRPLWGDREALERRFEERVAGYRAAELRVDARGDVNDVAGAVLAAIESAGL